jgi:hypothetical protein
MSATRVPGFAGKNLIPGEKPWLATRAIAWANAFGSKGRFATLRAWPKQTNIGCHTVALLGWVLAESGEASPTRDFVAASGRK